MNIKIAKKNVKLQENIKMNIKIAKKNVKLQ